MMIQELLLFFIGSFVSLFAIVDPLLAIPVFATLTEKYSLSQRIDTARRATVYVLGVMLVFFIAGGLILKFFGISLEGLRIAGGLMIMGTAVEMLQKKDRLLPAEQQESEEKEDIAFSPLAMPLLSGPGAIAVIIGMTSDATSWVHFPIILVVILLVAFSCYIMMRLSHVISQRMSQTMMKSFTRIMGFILLCIGVQYIVNGAIPLLRSALAS
jgi:multiple antibiotic resistance protein